MSPRGNGAARPSPKGHFRNNRMLWFAVFASLLLVVLCVAGPLLLLRIYLTLAGP